MKTRLGKTAGADLARLELETARHWREGAEGDCVEPGQQGEVVEED